MELTNEMIEQLKADLSGATTYSDLMGKDGAIKNLLAIIHLFLITLNGDNPLAISSVFTNSLHHNISGKIVL